MIFLFITECSQSQALINRNLSGYDFSAVSYESEKHSPEQARLGSEECWCSMSLNGTGHSPWVEVEFDDLVEVVTVSVEDCDTPFVNYNIQYGLNGGPLQYVINNDTGCGKVVHTVKPSRNSHYKPFRFFQEKQKVILKLFNYLLH